MEILTSLGQEACCCIRAFCVFFVIVVVFVILKFELGASTLSHSTSPVCVYVCVSVCVCEMGFFKIGSHKLFALVDFKP
jgi:hypothetical protein